MTNQYALHFRASCVRQDLFPNKCELIERISHLQICIQGNSVLLQVPIPVALYYMLVKISYPRETSRCRTRISCSGTTNPAFQMFTKGAHCSTYIKDLVKVVPKHRYYVIYRLILLQNYIEELNYLQHYTLSHDTHKVVAVIELSTRCY